MPDLNREYEIKSVKDILIICADGLTGIKEAIAAAFPDTEYQRCLVHQVRRLNAQWSVFPSDQALLKALYLSTFEATKKWTMSIRNWGKVYGELSIMYEGRLPD